MAEPKDRLKRRWSADNWRQGDTHRRRCQSTEPPYAERHVRWCGGSVNAKVGGRKKPNIISIYLLPDYVKIARGLT